MKKMLLATALALLITGALNRRLLLNKPAAVAPKETITPSFLHFGNGQKKLCLVICGGAENVVKTEAANIRKWIARFYYFRAFIPPLEA